MIRVFLCLWSFARNSDGAVLAETVIFAPIFVVLTIGITDLGAGMFVKMTVNAAAQAGAAYAANKCTVIDGACLAGIQTAMNNATGSSSLCTPSSACTALPCADPNGGTCFAVTANYPYTPILRDAMYAWGSTQGFSSTVIVRVK
jgi:Flp pilus assembly protein TadG